MGKTAALLQEGVRGTAWFDLSRWLVILTLGFSGTSLIAGIGGRTHDQ